MPKRLSPRQLECATLFAHGLQAQEIGRRLDIQTRTVETHIEEAYRRLEISGRPALRRALGIDYGRAPSPMPGAGSAVLDRPVDEADAASQTAPGTPTLYDRYAALGRWRTAPEMRDGRLTLIFAITVALLLLLGAMIALGSTVFEALDALNGASSK